jgi:hypothetical protein
MKRTKNSNRLIVSILTISSAFSLAGSGQAAEWQIDTVDRSGSGQFASMQVDTHGNVHVAYVPDIQGHPLKYAFRDTLGKWFDMTITNVASFSTLALDSKQYPHVSWADHGTGLGARLRHAQWDGAAWKMAPIDIQPGAVVAYYTGLALDSKDHPFLSYYDYADATNTFRLRLRSVSWVDDHWEGRTVDAQGGSGKFNSIAVDSAGHPHIAYANVKAETSGLRYATWDGSAWKTEIIEGQGVSIPVYAVSLVIDKKDIPHITYSLVQTGTIKYATKVAGKWVTQAVDRVREVAYPDRNGIAIDRDGTPYISYFDGRLGTLKIAHPEGGRWMAELLDQNFCGFTSSVAIHDDTLWVAYSDGPGRALKVAHRALSRTTAADQMATKR